MSAYPDHVLCEKCQAMVPMALAEDHDARHEDQEMPSDEKASSGHLLFWMTCVAVGVIAGLLVINLT